MKLLALLVLVTALNAAEVVVSTPNGGAVPDAEVAADGAVHLAYVKDHDVFYVKSADSGATWSVPLAVNSEHGTAHPPNTFRGPDIVWNEMQSAVHVAWYPGNPYVGVKTEGGVRYARLLKGAAAFEAERNLSGIPSDNISLAVDRTGNATVVWGERGFFTQSSGDGGAHWTKPEPLTIADACECCGTRSMFLPDGAFALAYRSKAENQRDMFLAVRRKGAWTQQRASGTPWNINACPMSGTSLSLTKNGAVMGIETKGAISWAEFGATGAKVRETIVRGASGKYPIALRAADGTTLVSWKDGTTLRWQIFSASDQPLGSAQSRPGTNATRHAGVVRKDGGILLVD